MKRFVAIILVLCLFLSLTGCKAWDYGKASKYYKQGQYAQALELYTALGDYADSQAMAFLSWQKADYEAAGERFAAGDYRRAMELYYGLGMYMDSPVKAIESQYALALALIGQGEFDEAIVLLKALGTYSDSIYQTHRATALWLRHALIQPGQVRVTPEGDGQQTLQMEYAGNGKVELTYTRESLLLGLPNTCRFVLTLYPETQTASYEASYLSVAASTVLEEASGMVDLATFGAGQGLSTYFFTQTITDPDGIVTVSNDTTHAIILQSLLVEATTAITQHLPGLLSQTGTSLTPEDLGFLSLG